MLSVGVCHDHHSRVYGSILANMFSTAGSLTCAACCCPEQGAACDQQDSLWLAWPAAAGLWAPYCAQLKQVGDGGMEQQGSLLHVQPAQRIVVNSTGRWRSLSFTRKQRVTCPVASIVTAHAHIPLLLHSSQYV